jgi:acetyl-CoA carboxylase carboxyltransferase component
VSDTPAPSEPPRTWAEALAALDARREAGRALGGPEAIARLHARGKLTARERVDRLFDPGTFRELGELATGLIEVPGRPDREAPADGVVTGWGLVGGRRVMVIADDGTITAGARGPAANRKAAAVRGLAHRHGYPFVLLLESSANRFQSMMGAQFAGDAEPPADGTTPPRADWMAEGRSPMVCAVLGTALGAASFQTMDAEFSCLAGGTAAMALAGPPVVQGGIGVETTTEQLGSGELHATTTGFIDHVADDEDGCLDAVRRFLQLFPDNSRELPPRVCTGDPAGRRSEELTDLVPLDHRKPYDMRRVVEAVVDHGELLESRPRFARNIICGWARIDGWSVGIIANQPRHLGGIVDVKAVIKAVRFAQVCNAYNIPLVFLQDQPGFIVGPDSEREGALRQVVRLMNAAYGATVPMLTVLVRKAYGFSTWLLGGRPVGADHVVAWPSGSISLAAPEIGVATLLRNELAAGELSEQRQLELYASYRQMSQARWAAYDFRIDDIIDPADTRPVLAAALAMAQSRRRAELRTRRTFDTA